MNSPGTNVYLADLDDEEVSGLTARTDLAWSRSGLALLSALAAVVKRVLEEYEAWGRATSVVVIGLIAGAVGWILAVSYGHRILASMSGRTLQEPRGQLRSLAAATTAFGLVALVVAFA